MLKERKKEEEREEKWDRPVTSVEFFFFLLLCNIFLREEKRKRRERRGRRDTCWKVSTLFRTVGLIQRKTMKEKRRDRVIIRLNQCFRDTFFLLFLLFLPSIEKRMYKERIRVPAYSNSAHIEIDHCYLRPFQITFWYTARTFLIKSLLSFVREQVRSCGRIWKLWEKKGIQIFCSKDTLLSFLSLRSSLSFH